MSNRARSAEERKKVRWLLFVYDALIYFCCAMLIFIRPLGTHTQEYSGIPQTLLMFLCVFSCRLFVFRVYHQIWRKNTLRAYARLFASDVLGGSVAVFLISFCRIPFLWLSASILRTTALALINLVVSLFARFLYFYLFVYIKAGGPFAKQLRHVMERITLVDFDSEDGVMNYILVPANASSEPINAVQNIVRRFSIRGDVLSIKLVTKGYINSTYIIETKSEYDHIHKYILQRINTNVFKNPDELMSNIMLITNHLRGRLELPGCPARDSATLDIRMTKDGRSFFSDDSGCWRMMRYIDDAYSMATAESAETFYYAGQSFGKFMLALSDLNPDDIHDTIPMFHNTKQYYFSLEDAVAADRNDRVKECQNEISFVRDRADKLDIITSALENGQIPRRICHNDTNLNNILFSKDSHLPVAIIDLDTVMATTPLYDFGDSMRIGTNKANDDEKDLSKVSCDLELYEAYANGYLEACGSILTESELALLPYAACIVTMEDGIRFLMDHINGDCYYNIFYPGQNLDRCRTQLALVRDMESKMPEILKIHEKIYARLGLKTASVDDKVNV